MAKVKLGTVCEIVGTLIDPRDSDYSKLTHVGGANIVSGTGRLQSLKSAEEESLISGKFLFEESDILYRKIRPYLKKVARPHFKGICSADIYPLRQISTFILRDYLYYLLLTDDFTEYVERVSNRAGMPKVNRDQLFAYEFELPSLPDQERIIRSLELLISNLEEARDIREASMQDLAFLDVAILGDTERSLSCPSSPIGSLILSSRNGRSIATTTQEPNGSVLTLSAVRHVLLDHNCNKAVRLAEGDAENYSFSKSHVLVSRSNTRELVGLSSLAAETPPPNLIFPDLLIRLEPDTELIRPAYLAIALRFPSSRAQIRLRAKGTSQSMVKISGASLKEICIPVPLTLDEQDKVVAKVESAFRISAAVRDEMLPPPFDAMRRSILRKAFAGEL